MRNASIPVRKDPGAAGGPTYLPSRTRGQVRGAAASVEHTNTQHLCRI